MSHKPPESPLKSLLWLWQKAVNHKNKEAGNTLIIAISLGVLLVGATSTMVFTSSKNRTNVTSDEMSVRAQEVAELGITRAVNFLAKNPQFAMDNKPDDTDRWNSSNSPIEVSGIPERGYENYSTSNNTCSAVLSQTQNASLIAEASNVEFIFEQLVNVSNPSQGQFALENYIITDPNGVETNFETIKNNNNTMSSGDVVGFGQLSLESSFTNNSQARIKATFPLIKQNPNWENIPFPGVWLGDQSTSSRTNPVDADVMISAEDCDNLQLQVQQGRSFIISSGTFPLLPTFPTVNPSLGIYDLGNLIGADMNITLPRSGDNHDGSGVYHYIVNEISGQGSRTLTITPGQKVYIYLKGKIEIKGSAQVSHSCGSNPDCRPENFRIYGYGYKTGDKPQALGSQDLTSLAVSDDPLLCLRGSGSSQGFIFAPGYQAMVSGAGSGDAFYGTVWVKRWANSDVNCGSNTSNTVVTQDDSSWETLGLFPQMLSLPPRVGSVSQWQREGVN